VRFPGVLVVQPSFEAQTIPQLIAYAKANPGKINISSGGVGSAQHLFGELFKAMAGVDMVHVPYRGGGQALIDLLAGRVSLMFDTLPTSIDHIRAGKLRPLAVTAAAPVEVLPDVSTVNEFVPGYEAERLGRHWCPEKYARRQHQQAQYGDQCRPPPPQDKCTHRRSGEYLVYGFARRVW
jgi:tripartite-type tricarboxylate transporter receptor subunit TctC